jgi:hypothetical protein
MSEELDTSSSAPTPTGRGHGGHALWSRRALFAGAAGAGAGAAAAMVTGAQPASAANGGSVLLARDG